MKKLIDIPDNIIVKLKVLAAKENKNLTVFIKDKLIEISKQKK